MLPLDRFKNFKLENHISLKSTEHTFAALPRSNQEAYLTPQTSSACRNRGWVGALFSGKLDIFRVNIVICLIVGIVNFYIKQGQYTL